MYANLLGQKAIRKMTNYDMACVIGVSRPAYEEKMRSGRFTPKECFMYMRFFNKTFDYLFDMDDEPKKE